MTIDYAILGMLDWKPMTGYDIKQMMQDSSILYWSGNNNQVYRSLVQLLKQGLVTNTTVYQSDAPNKKVYAITDAGRATLRAWAADFEPEPPEWKKSFLIQLLWAGTDTALLDRLAGRYEDILLARLAMLAEELRRRRNFPDRSREERFVWDMAYENLQESCQGELNWIRRFRTGLWDPDAEQSGEEG